MKEFFRRLPAIERSHHQFFNIAGKAFMHPSVRRIFYRNAIPQTIGLPRGSLLQTSPPSQGACVDPFGRLRLLGYGSDNEQDEKECCQNIILKRLAISVFYSEIRYLYQKLL